MFYAEINNFIRTGSHEQNINKNNVVICIVKTINVANLRLIILFVIYTLYPSIFREYF